MNMRFNNIPEQNRREQKCKGELKDSDDRDQGGGRAFAAWADAVCKVGLLVCGDTEKVDRTKVGDEIVEILNAFVRECAAEEAMARELKLYREIALGLMARPEVLALVTADQACAGLVERILYHRKDPFERGSAENAAEQILDHLEELGSLVDD